MSAALYPQLRTSEDGSVGTANTNRDGTTGSYTTLATGTAAGKEITDVVWMADTTTTAGFIRLFVHDGTTAVMIAELPIAPCTPVATFPQIPVLRGVFTPVDGQGKPKPIVLSSTSHTLKASTHVSETFRLLAEGRTY